MADRRTSPTGDRSHENTSTVGSGGGPSVAQIGLAVGLSVSVLLIIAYFTFDASAFWNFVQRMDVLLLLAAIGTVVVRVIVGAKRMQFVSNGGITYHTGLRGQLSWEFFSNVTPSAIGGAPFAALYVARDSNIRVGDSTAIMLFSMLLDQMWLAFCIPLLLAASFFIPVFPDALGTVGTGFLVLVFLGMLAWVVTFAYAMLVRPDFLERWLGKLFQIRWLRRFRTRAERELLQLKRRAVVLRSQPISFFVIGFLYTAAAWILRYLTLLFVVWCVFEQFDQVLLLFRTAAMLVGSLLMPTPGASGGIEGLYALFISPLLPAAIVAPTLLAWRVMAYHIFIALGTYLTMHHVNRRRRRAENNGGEAKTSSSEPLVGEK